ncbi:MAG: AAA family ATPase [Acidimicrobiia bacterium]
MDDIRPLGESEVLADRHADVVKARERKRLRKLAVVAVVLAIVFAWIMARVANGLPIVWHFPSLPSGVGQYLPQIVLIALLGGSMLLPLVAAGRSPHMIYRPSEISVTFDDVVGIGVVKEEVIKSLNLFLAYETFRKRMGGNPRRALLFEGPPGTGKTYMAKAMAREAGVPFLFVSASAFQSMYYGQTNRKVRSYFRALRKAARREGGAIGFIEEIDAIAGARSGMRFSGFPDGALSARTVSGADSREGITGVVNELLVQMQSFDQPTGTRRLLGLMIDLINQWLPRRIQISKRSAPASNVLVIGATNRAADLDPALLRPGRFDRSLHFDLPSRSGRREIIDYYLARKSHSEELEKEDLRDQLAAITFGYSPVMIEHLFDEALVWALRGGRDAMTWRDVQQAKMTEEIGLKQPVEYTPEEKVVIATHEAGHAVVAYLVGTDRKLEVLSIIKRSQSLGLLAHSDLEERFTKSRSELLSGIQIAFGGMVAEELFFGESGTGPSGDLSAATRTAAMMIGALGMGSSLVSYEAIESGPVSQGLVGRVLGDEAGRAAVEDLLSTNREVVRAMLNSHRHLVERLRDALLDREELVGDEILIELRAAELEYADRAG